MNGSRTWVLWSIVLVLFGFIALVEFPIRRERWRPPDHHILPGLNPNVITNIEIQAWERPAIAAERAATNQPWRLRRPISYPAEGEAIDALLWQLANLQWQERIPEDELKQRQDALDSYGLTKPHYSILLQGSGASRRLEIGEQTAYGDEVFFSLVGGTSVYLASSNVLGLIPANKDLWRSTKLLDLAATPFDAIEVRASGEEFYLELDPTNHLWLMKKPQPARADTPKVNALLSELQQLHIRAFLPDDAQPDSADFGFQAGHAPNLALTFYAGTNVVAGLQAGAPTPPVQGEPKLVFARRSSPSNIVAAPGAPLASWEMPYTNFLDQHFISLPPEMIHSIEVQGIDHFRVQRQTNSQWLVVGKETFPADPELMQSWLASLTNIQTEIKKAVPANLAEYGLTNPMLTYALELSPAAGSQAAPKIEFGANTAGQIFERRPDEYAVNTITPDDFLRLPRVSWQLRDRAIWNFDSSNVVSVTVRQLGGEQGYLRDPMGEWTVAPGSHWPLHHNPAEWDEIIYRLGRLKAVYWDGEGDDPQDFFGIARADYKLEIGVRRDSRVETLRLDFGARSPYSHRYAAIVRDGRRLIFEFPADLYDNFVRYDLSVPAALRHRP